MRKFHYKKPVFAKKSFARTNEQIRLPKIRVVDEDGGQLGVMSSFEAMEIARSRELDLVEIAPKADPPVCRIMDYGKYQYQQSKQDRISKAKQKKIDMKGIRIGLKTDTHDLDFKKDQIVKFLQKGNKVKLEIHLRGREKAHKELARKILDDFAKELAIPFKKEQEIKSFPGGFNMIIAP